MLKSVLPFPCSCFSFIPYSNWCVFFLHRIESNVYKNSWGFQSDRIMNRRLKTGVKLAELIDKLLGNGKNLRIIVVKFITVITYTVPLSFNPEKTVSSLTGIVALFSLCWHSRFARIRTLCCIERGVSNLITARSDQWDNVERRKNAKIS